MTTRILVGHCVDTLATLPEKSVQCVITSPPYYGLRDYGLEPSTWADGWSGCLGLEPTPELFLEHLVEVFRVVRRVLRDDGCIWVNMGDSYAGSGKGPTGHNGIGNQGKRQGFTGGAKNSPRKLSKTGTANGKSEASAAVRMLGIPGFKAKDLMMMPARLAMALQADGWYLRSQMPWIKRNSMPESVTDRPATAVEYVFLLSKGPKYFWDADAVRNESNHPNLNGKTQKVSYHDAGSLRQDGDRTVAWSGFRSRRNSDWFFESWQGLELDEDGDPLALVVNPSSYKGAHYATFPPKLVEPMIKAGTSEKGQCPECGAPWARVSVRGESDYARMKRENDVTWADMHAVAEGQGKGLDGPTRQHIGGTRDASGNQFKYTAAEIFSQSWRPTCTHAEWKEEPCAACGGSGIEREQDCIDCNGKGTIKTLISAPEPVPQTVLDCFFGSGTVGMMAERLGRNAVGCELNPEYAQQAVQRVMGGAPMFTDVEVS